MKPSILTAIAAAGALSASATACPLPQHATNSGGSSQPTRILTTTTTSSCTPRIYWLPAQCSSDRSVASAAKTTQHGSAHASKTDSETCTPRIYWFAAHCQ